VLVPALPSFIIVALWDQFAALIPERVDTHPLGRDNPRIPDRVVFEKLLQVVVLGASHQRIADSPARPPASAVAGTSGSAPGSSSGWNSSAWRPTTGSSAWTWNR
jgi:hypothetical protein